MVMKGRPSPRTSIWGTALSLGLLLAAAAATPILACPPDEKEKVKAAEQALKVELQRQQALEKSQVERTKALEKAEKERATALEKAATQRQAALEKAAAERHAAIEKAQVERHKALELAEAMRRNELAKATAEKAAVDAEAATTFEQFMRNRGQGGDDTTELLRRLLDRIERLEKRLDSFERQGGRSALPGSGRLTTTQPLMPAPSVEGSVTAVQAPSASTPQPTLTSSRSAPTTAMSSGGAVGGSAPSLMAATSTDRISRQYTLPKGKLELLNQLMIREDVPVLVSPSSNSITVHGTAEQHKTFKAFIDMIHPTADLSAPASAPGVPAAQPPAPGAQPAAPRGGSASGRVSTTTADAAHTANLHTAMSSLAKQADQLDVHSTALQAVIDQLKARASKAGEAEKQDIHREMERLVAELVRLHTQAADVRAQAYMARVASEAARQQAVEETTPR